MKRILLLLVLFVVVIKLQAGDESRYSELQTFARVLNIIEKSYVEPVEVKKLIQGAIKGMLRELDPHSAYLNPDVFKEFENETSGEFGGIGIEITIDGGQLTIISAIEDTPAFAAGLQAKDKILAINGISTKGFNLIDASRHLKGRRGDKVTLTISREGIKPFDITIVRGSVKIKSVKSQTFDETYLYIKITSFIENTSSSVEKVIQEHISQKKELSGIILDLRRNPGGLLDQAIKVSDLFLEDGLTIVSTQGRQKETKEVTTATKRPKYTGFPMLVLIDAGSASASEIVAGALQDHKRALIMGSRSFGKGSVQSIMKLGDGSALKLTIARYYTPSGRSIQAEGILPDLIFENSSDSPSTTAVLKDGTSKVRKIRERDIENHLNNDKKITPEKPDTWTDSDLTLAQAVNYIKAMSYGARNQKGAEQIAK